MTSSTDQSALAAVLATGRVKFISALVVIALVLGIVAEVIAIDTSYYNLRKARCDASLSATEAKAKGSSVGGGESFGTRQKDYLHDCLE